LLAGLSVVIIQLKEDLLQNEERLRHERRQHRDAVTDMQGCCHRLSICDLLVVKTYVQCSLIKLLNFYWIVMLVVNGICLSCA